MEETTPEETVDAFCPLCAAEGRTGKHTFHLAVRDEDGSLRDLDICPTLAAMLTEGWG